MKTLLHTSLLILLLFIIQGQSCIDGKNYGPSVKETREVADFDELEISHGIDVFLSMGSEEQLEVEAPEDLLDELVTEVRGGKLKIYYDRSFNWNNGTKIYLQAKKLKKINTSGGSDLVCEDLIKSKNLELEASGGSDIKLEIQAKDLDVKVSGGSDIVLSGEADFLSANSSGGSDLKAFDLIVGKADLEASGGSDINITVEEELDGRASGGADIEYMGNPKILKTNASASGDIKKRE